MYSFTRSEGLVHIHTSARPKECIACVRTDAFEVIWQESRREAIEEMRAAVTRTSTRPDNSKEAG